MSYICVLRCILVLVNIIIGLIAGAITVIGGIYIWGEKSLHNTLHTFIVDGISTLTIKKGITKLFFNVFQEIQPLGVYIFVSGLIIFIICLLGVIGTCFKSRLIIYIYLTFHVLVLIPEIVIIIVYFCRSDIVTTFSRNIFNSSIHRYIGYDSPDIHSYALNHIMIQLQCCGINNGSDFSHVKMTKRNIMYKGEPYGIWILFYFYWKNISLLIISCPKTLTESTVILFEITKSNLSTKNEFQYPISCCKMDRNQEITNNGCPDEFTLENSNIHVGCWPKIESYIIMYGNITAYILCGAVGLQILFILFALTIIRTGRKIKPI